MSSSSLFFRSSRSRLSLNSFFFFSFSCACAALFSSEKFSNSKEIFVKLLEIVVVSSMWYFIKISAFEFFTSTTPNIIVSEFSFFFKNLFLTILFIFTSFVDFSSILIIFLFSSFFFIHLLQRCCIKQLNRFDNSFFCFRQALSKTSILSKKLFH